MVRKILAVALCLMLFAQMISISAAAQEEIPFEVYTMKESAPSEYGYIEQEFVNEKGEEINFEDNEIEFESEEPPLYYSSYIPSSYDLRDYGYVSPVTTQGSAGNC